MSSYVNSFTATLWCTRFVAQLKDANEGWVRTTARLLQKEHVVMVSRSAHSTGTISRRVASRVKTNPIYTSTPPFILRLPYSRFLKGAVRNYWRCILRFV